MAPAPAPILLPRGLIFLAFLWLVVSWALSIGLRLPLFPSPASYEPGVRLMMMCVLIGLVIGWPLYRLSGRTTTMPLMQTVLDLVVLLSMTQVVVWPLRLITEWTPARTAAIDCTLMGWGLLAGAAVAVAVGSDRWSVRAMSMFACVAMCLLGPITAWTGVVFGFDLDLVAEFSPLLALNALGQGGSAPQGAVEWPIASIPGLAAILAWTAVLLSRRFPSRFSGDPA